MYCLIVLSQGLLGFLTTASCSDVVRNSKLRRESEIDVGVEGTEDDTVQALVSPRMFGFTLTATALAGACSGASVICTTPKKSGVLLFSSAKLSVVSLQLHVLALPGL